MLRHEKRTIQDVIVKPTEKYKGKAFLNWRGGVRILSDMLEEALVLGDREIFCVAFFRAAPTGLGATGTPSRVQVHREKERSKESLVLQRKST